MDSLYKKTLCLTGGTRHIVAMLLAGVAMLVSLPAHAVCERELFADVVAFDMPLMWNRLGAHNINGMMYALRHDVVQLKNNSSDPQFDPYFASVDEANDLKPESQGGVLKPGHVTLRPDKRPRPLVLRMGTGDCLTIKLTNLLSPRANPFHVKNDNRNESTACTTQPGAGDGEERSGIAFNCQINDQVHGRKVSLRFSGVELVGGSHDDGSYVGYNESSLVEVGQSRQFKIRGIADGTFVGQSYGQTLGGEGLGGTTASGLWAVLNVNAKGAGFFRSTMTNEEMELAKIGNTADGHPLIDWQATYPSGDINRNGVFDECVNDSGDIALKVEASCPDGYYGEAPTAWDLEGKAGRPVVNMIAPKDGYGGEIVHSNIDAIVAYVGDDFATLATPDNGGYKDRLGHFPAHAYPLESAGFRNPTVPNRLEPFREFTVAFHDEVGTKQAFPGWFEDPVFGHTLHGVSDSFMINYGSGGIGSEIIANRLGVGPMHDCVNCAYEEFFLSFSTVGEVGQLVDTPANFGLENCDPNLNNCGAVGPKANYVLYPEDPSNVHHSYVGDSTAFRNVHAGPGEQHVFHLHNHQWLFNADDDNSNYVDAQGLGPGSGYAYWVNFGGSGNRNKTAGDAIFHCHFYPHFAQGMWEMWRIHDTFEPGTALQTTLDGDGSHIPFTEDGLGLGNGTPAPGARALPDGEIVAGAPTPAVVPLPGKPMAPYPAQVTVKENPNQVPVCAYGSVRDASDGSCPSGETMMQAVGSLTDVIDRSKNPGYPFWIAGMEHTVGNRVPTPPLDMITNEKARALQDSGGDLWQHPGFAATAPDGTKIVDGWDGGLPRFTVHGYAAGGKTKAAQTRLDMSKEFLKAKPVFFPEEGTDLEQVAMAFHAERCHPSYLPNGEKAECDENEQGGFITNGALPVPGAPFQEPCIDDKGELLTEGYGNGYFFGGDLAAMWDHTAMTVRGSSPHTADRPRYFKAANVQFDAVFNKLGYHFPQQRIIAHWQDVVPTIDKERAPEPFVFRMNTFDCAQYVHSNVVPKAYELDDYQVRTPTDIIGQHIHLPKWDLVSADGAANGWNYEDGTLSPEAVVEMIAAINAWNADPSNTPVITDYKGNRVVDSAGHSLTDWGTLEPADHPFFGQVNRDYAVHWKGARSTMQRWFADPVVNVQGTDRGLGIVFTHDHYGPSTHQQIGLYATLLVEPAGSKWAHNETGQGLNLKPDGTPYEEGRIDGGPTSWQAMILTGADAEEYQPYNAVDYQNVKADQIENHREFYYEYTDFQHAYQKGVYVGAGPDGVALEDYAPVDENHDGLIDNPWADYVAYVPQRLPTAGADIRNSFRDAIQPSIRKQASLKPDASGFPVDIWKFPAECIDSEEATELGLQGPVYRPCPEAISADDIGMYVANYRNESLLARVYDPNKPGPDANGNDCSDPLNRSGCGTQADGRSGDLAFAMHSGTKRAIAALNSKNGNGNVPAGYLDNLPCDDGTGNTVFCPPINNAASLAKGDPFTPMMRTFDGDRTHIKMQAGGQEEEHSAILHGLKWLQGGSGFGESRNSGWRNAQAGGIAEQFTLRTPIVADQDQAGPVGDYAWSMNASLDGWASGTWGLLRNYGQWMGNLARLPDNEPAQPVFVVNAGDFDGVCPAGEVVIEQTVVVKQRGRKKEAVETLETTTEWMAKNLRSYEVVAVLAEDVLPELGGSASDPYPNAHEGRSPNGGTLVYNSRDAYIPAADVGHEGGEGAAGGTGPLNDPAAILYIEKNKLVFDETGSRTPFGDPVGLQAGAAAGPLVIRGNAGDCLDVTLYNALLAQATDANGAKVFNDGDYQPVFEDRAETHLCVEPLQDLTGDPETGGPDGICDHLAQAPVTWDRMPDLATGNAIPAMVRRDRDSPQGMTAFQNNLMAPSAKAGLHAALVEYDVTRADGNVVGSNDRAEQLAHPGSQTTYRWYAGDISPRILDPEQNADVCTIGTIVQATSGDTSEPEKKNNKGRGKSSDSTTSEETLEELPVLASRCVELVATPIEFGGFNIMPADKVKQGQKGMVAAGVIYPQGSTWTVDEGSNTSASVTTVDLFTGAEKTFRDFTVVTQKGASMFYQDWKPVQNILGEGSFGVAEDAQDMGHMAINYRTEPLWHRFGINPTDADGMANVSNGHEAYSNQLMGGVDPQTPVFTVASKEEFRKHVLFPFGPGRGSTYDLHGHAYQRDPYVCPYSGAPEDGVNLPGRCDMGAAGLTHKRNPGDGHVGSLNIGLNPQGMILGGIESWFAGQHYEIYSPSAGGLSGVTGDYLFRDRMGLGNAQGLWGILRVQ